MPFYLTQSGTLFSWMTQAGVATTLTLPSGVTLIGTTQPCRASILSGYTVVVNGGTKDFYVDLTETLRPLRLEKPATPPKLAAGVLTGKAQLDAKYQVVVTFKVKDEDGKTIQESEPGPPGSVELSAPQSIKATAVPVSLDAAVNARGLYIGTFDYTVGTVQKPTIVFGDSIGYRVEAPPAPTVTIHTGVGTAVFDYVVATVGVNGTSEVSATTTITNGLVPLGSGQFNRVTWTSMPNATGYRVFRQYLGTWTRVGQVAAGTLTLDDVGQSGATGAGPSTNTSDPVVGTVTYGYKIVAVGETGEANASTEGLITTSVLTLTTTRFNRISWPAVPNAIKYKVYRTTENATAGGGNTTGLIGETTDVFFDDIGMFATSGTAATVNTTGIQNVPTLYFHWCDIDDNTRTSVEELVNTDLHESFPVFHPISAPPDFKLICEWRDRLWAIPRVDVDFLRWSNERQAFDWPIVNEIVIPPKGTDIVGVNAFIPRRDALGIGRKNSLHRMTGYGNDTFNREKIADVGVASQASVVVVRDTAYFLGFDAGRYGFFEWSDEGVVPISEMQVDSWLNTTTYFNSAEYDICEGRYNPDTDAVEWLLAAVGQATLNRWVSFHTRTRGWYGPHTTGAFTPSSGATSTRMAGVLTATGDATQLAVFGATDGRLYKRDGTATNDHLTAVDFDCDLPFLSDGEPDVEKAWLQPTIHSEVKTAGTLTITPKVGSLAAAASSPVLHDLTTGRERLPRLGFGRYLQLRLRHNTASESCRVYGLEIPYIPVGRR